jgi:hypothetical protein
VAARLARRHVARATWANDGKGVPPTPNLACFLAGDTVDGRQPKWVMPLMAMPAGQQATWTCQRWLWRHGSLQLTAIDGITCQETCRIWGWRHPLAIVGPGGTCHVSPGQTCRHSEVVSFDNIFQRWSFLPFHWCRWLDLSKIRGENETRGRYFSI